MKELPYQLLDDETRSGDRVDRLIRTTGETSIQTRRSIDLDSTGGLNLGVITSTHANNTIRNKVRADWRI